MGGEASCNYLRRGARTCRVPDPNGPIPGVRRRDRASAAARALSGVLIAAGVSAAVSHGVSSAGGGGAAGASVTSRRRRLAWLENGAVGITAGNGQTSVRLASHAPATC
jgi:hypothetical protein